MQAQNLRYNTMRLLATISLLLCFTFTFAQKVSIKGSAKGYEHSLISINTHNDYISNSQKQLTYTVIDSAADFLLEWNTKQIQYITIRINQFYSNMYVQPNTNYEIIIFPPDSTTYINKNIEHSVQLSIKLNSKTEINALTMDFEKRFDYFTSMEYIAFVERKPLEKIDSFKTSVNNFYSSVNNNYFKTYINYSIASLEAEAKASEKKLYNTYLHNKPIDYNHPEYMHFFNSFYKKKLQTFANQKGGDAIYFQVNNRGSFSGTKELLKKYDYLNNDTICELVLIKNLYDSYYDGSFDKKSILAMFEQAKNETKIEQHKIIIQNILNSFSKLQKGTAAPYFELPDKTDKTLSLDELRSDNKYVYVTVFDPKCTSCIQQMKVIPSLQKEYGKRIAFVSIATDVENEEYKKFIAQNPKFTWPIVHDNSSGKFKKEYEIKSLPAYFLIDPEGKFVQIPADSPEQEIERAFIDIVKPKAKIHGVGDKKNH